MIRIKILDNGKTELTHFLMPNLGELAMMKQAQDERRAELQKVLSDAQSAFAKYKEKIEQNRKEE